MKNLTAAFFIGIVLLFLAGTAGYVMNIVKIFGTDFASPYKAEVIRAVGVFVPPVGAIAGWFTIED